MIIAAFYLLFAYIAASLWESTFHHHVLHARRRTKLTWRTWGTFGSLLRLAHFFHQTIHHRRTFRHSLLVQFDSPAQRQALDSLLKGSIGRRARLDRYGLTVTGALEFVAFTGLPLLVNSLVAITIEPWLLPFGTLASALPLLLSRYVHPLLHQPAPPASAAGLIHALRRTSVFQFLQGYHLLHHVRRTTNFNLLLGVDWFLGQAVSPRTFRGEQRSEA